MRPICCMLTAVLLAFVGAAPARAVELVHNGDFSSRMDGWQLLLLNGALAFPDSTSGAVCTTVSNGGLSGSDVLLLQRLVPLEQGGVYRLRFTASADASRSIVAHLGSRAAPFTTYASTSVSLTTTPQSFEAVFTMAEASDPCATLVFWVGGTSNTGVCIDDVSLEEVTPPPPGPADPPLVLPASPSPPLRELASARDFIVGTAVRAEPLLCEADYAQVLDREYNHITPELELLFNALRPESATYSFHLPDQMIDFAEQRGMEVFGHTLVWHEALPPWIVHGQLSALELRNILRGHILTIAGYFAGRIDVWGVVNEAIDFDGSMRNTLWLRAIGPDYIDQAFQWARQADPGARLIYNDFGIEDLGAKSDGVFALVQGLVARGIPIDGVGFQSHFATGFPPPPPEEIALNMQRYAALGLDVYITEMDAALSGTPSPADLAAQAEIYRELIGVCLMQPNCHTFTTWGFTDKHSWVSELLPGFGSAHPFDAGYAPKPAYDAMHEELMITTVNAAPSLSPAGLAALVGVMVLVGALRRAPRAGA